MSSSQAASPLPLTTTTPTDTVTGGTAACVVASRLSDASPSLSILIIENGTDSADDPAVRYPALGFGNFLPTSNLTLFYESVSEPSTNDRRVVVPSGGTLGGGSAINMLTYSRAQRTDFETWKTPGWGADDLLPLMKKIETYHGPGSAGVHGDSGPLQVSASTYIVPETEETFIAAAAARGWPEAVDIQDFETVNASQKNLRYITKEGKRSDAAEAYLRPRVKDGKHPGLQVLVEHQVARVLFEGTKATGVEVRSNPKFQPDATGTKTIKACKLVVVSCGALGTPLVLERSGVGSPEVLSKAGVEVVADLPGVGNEYLDHHLHGKSA